MLQLLCGKSIINFIYVHAHQPGLSAEEKDGFYEQLLVLVTSVAPSRTLVVVVELTVMLVSIAKVSVRMMVGMVMEHWTRKE